MTTTSTYQGLGEDSKPTSRVLKPPGGGSSNIFGGPEPAAAAPKPRGTPAKKADSGIFGGASSGASDAGSRTARDGDDSFQHLFGTSASTQSPSGGQRQDTHSNLFGSQSTPAPERAAPRGDTYANLFGGQEPASRSRGGGADSHSKIFGSAAPGQQESSTHANLFGGAQPQAHGQGSYNPITGADYKDLAPNHHALHIKEPPKPQKEQPPLPCSDGEFQAKEGKMQNVQTSTRISNPPGGKTHKLW